MPKVEDFLSIEDDSSRLFDFHVGVEAIRLHIRHLRATQQRLFSYRRLLIVSVIGFVIGAIGGISSVEDVGRPNQLEYYTEVNDSLKARRVNSDNISYSYEEGRDSALGPEYSRDIAGNYINDSLMAIREDVEGNVHSRLNSIHRTATFTFPLIGGGIGVAILLVLYSSYGLMAFSLKRRRINRLSTELNNLGAAELKRTIKEDFFTKLVEINFKYIDQYYLQTQEQADKSFLVTVWAAIVGFAIVATGIITILYYAEKSDPAKLTTVTGVVTEFIAAVFFYLYNRTVQKMSHYHQKLVITQNISLALKTAEELGAEKEKVLEKIIDRLTADVNTHLAS